MNKVLVVNNLDFSYDNNSVFENLTFYLETNTVNFVIGSNNSGKTTLIKTLSGVLPSFNCIKIENVLLNQKNINRYVRMMGVVLFENKNQFLFDNVLNELTFPLENLCITRKKIFKRIDEVLELLNIKNILYKKIDELTNIERTKLLIGLSILHKPRIIFLDNPYINLNKKESNIINKLLNLMAKKEGITVLITTNDLENVLSSDKVIVLGNKCVAFEGDPLTVLKQDNKLSKLGINMPLMIDLSIKLGQYDLLDKVILDTDRMVEVLWK